MKKTIIAAIAASAAISAAAWDETGYYYPEQEPDSIWQEWYDFTTADVEWGGLNAGFFSYDQKVKKRVSKDPANKKFQFALVEYFAAGTDLIVEYDPDTKEFRIPIQRKGVNNMWDGEPFLATDWKTFYGTADPYSSWNETDGILQIYVVNYYPNQDMGDGTFGDKVYAGGIDIYRMHGFTRFDVDIDVPECVSTLTPKTKLNITTHPKNVSWELVNDLVLPYDTLMIDKIAERKLNPITESTEVELSLKEGVNSLVCISYDNKDNRVVSIRNIYAMPDDATGWKSLGQGTFVEDAVMCLGGDWDVTRLPVEVQEKTDKPGYYRIVDPYKGLPSKCSDFTYTHSGHSHYLYLDASKPNVVVLEAAPTGVSHEAQLKSAYLTSKAYEAKRAGELQPQWIANAGKLADNKITFPAGSIGVRLPEYTSAIGQDLIYWVNNNGQFSLELPDNSGVENIGTEEIDAPARWFNMQGVEISEPAEGEMVIEVRGNRSTKIIYRH